MIHCVTLFFNQLCVKIPHNHHVIWNRVHKFSNDAYVLSLFVDFFFVNHLSQSLSTSIYDWQNHIASRNLLPSIYHIQLFITHLMTRLKRNNIESISLLFLILHKKRKTNPVANINSKWMATKTWQYLVDGEKKTRETKRLENSIPIYWLNVDFYKNCIHMEIIFDQYIIFIEVNQLTYTNIYIYINIMARNAC